MSQRVQGNFKYSPHGRFLKDQCIFNLLATEPRHDPLVCWDSAMLQPQLTIHTQVQLLLINEKYNQKSLFIYFLNISQF